MKGGEFILTLSDFRPFEINNLIRMGATNDGGYLLPSDCKADLLISLGLGDDWKFELDLIKNNYVDKFIIFDHTKNLSTYVKSLLNRTKLNNFKLTAFTYRLLVLLRYFKDFTIMRNNHVKRKITQKGSSSINMHAKRASDINLLQIFNEFVKSPNVSVILKIDIEGSEYEIIEQILDFSNQITLLIVEFHDIIVKKHEFEKCLRLLKSKYSLIHSHINNYGHVNKDFIPQVCEFTFIKNTLFHGTNKVNKLPRKGLDSPSTPSRKDFEINFIKV